MEAAPGVDMEIRIEREKRHLEVGEEQHREEEEAPVAEQVQLTIVGEGFYGLGWAFFVFSFSFLSQNHAPALKFLIIIWRRLATPYAP